MKDREQKRKQKNCRFYHLLRFFHKIQKRQIQGREGHHLWAQFKGCGRMTVKHWLI